MLDVQRRIDVDAGRKQFLDVEIALGMAATRRVGMGKLVDQRQFRPSGEQGVEVHFLYRPALIVDGLAGHDFKAPHQRFGLGSAMKFRPHR